MNEFKQFCNFANVKFFSKKIDCWSNKCNEKWWIEKYISCIKNLNNFHAICDEFIYQLFKCRLISSFSSIFNVIWVLFLNIYLLIYFTICKNAHISTLICAWYFKIKYELYEIIQRLSNTNFRFLNNLMIQIRSLLRCRYIEYSFYSTIVFFWNVRENRFEQFSISFYSWNMYIVINNANS